MPRVTPDLTLEHELLTAGARVVAGIDEVGRGAIGGGLAVGVVAVDASTPPAPDGLADSKLLSAHARQALVPRLAAWGRARAVGRASAAEIDALGIIAALRLAATRALETVEAALGHTVDVVILDGSHDWLTRPAQGDLFAAPDDSPQPHVRMRVKADQSCASVAAASVLAKCERDADMVALAEQYPGYAWDVNKGYASPAHIAGLREHGVSDQHRKTWRLQT